MRKSALGVLLGVLMCSSAANAQEQRGSIEGVVRDAQSALVPGVVVEARNAAGVTVTTVTDVGGTYRFPSVAPGIYAVKASLAGFRPQEYERVEVLLGQIKRADFTLAVEEESLEVDAGPARRLGLREVGGKVSRVLAQAIQDRRIENRSGGLHDPLDDRNQLAMRNSNGVVLTGGS